MLRYMSSSPRRRIAGRRSAELDRLIRSESVGCERMLREAIFWVGTIQQISATERSCSDALAGEIGWILISLAAQQQNLNVYANAVDDGE